MNNSHNILQSVKTTSRLSTGTTHLFHSRKTSLLHSTKKQCWAVLSDVCPRHLVGSFQCFHQFPEAYQSSLINSRHVNSEMLPVTWITQDVIKLENLDVKEERERMTKHKPCGAYFDKSKAMLLLYAPYKKYIMQNFQYQTNLTQVPQAYFQSNTAPSVSKPIFY